MRVATAGSERVLADLPKLGGKARGEPPALSSGAWRDLRVRLISAGVLAPLGLACLINGGWPFVALVLLVAVGLGVEWEALGRTRRHASAPAMAPFWLGLSLAAVIASGTSRLSALGVGWLDGLRLLLAGFLLGSFRGAGIVLIGVGSLALLWLRGMTGDGVVSLLFVVLVVWASDSLAYLVGRALGGARLAPRISPGKTRSGAVGGLCGAMVAGRAGGGPGAGRRGSGAHPSRHAVRWSARCGCSSR